MIMKDLLPLAETIAARLKARKETIAVAESSTGGLISAALLSVGGASAYFMGGGVVYTRQAKQMLLSIDDAAIAQFRAATEGHALILARAARARFNTTWALSETGATGPTGNRYGDPAGHTCFALVGASEKALTLETGKDDRVENMRLFAAAGLKLLADALA
jgi:nicotinamide-nucleotide amidase